MIKKLKKTDAENWVEKMMYNPMPFIPHPWCWRGVGGRDEYLDHMRRSASKLDHTLTLNKPALPSKYFGQLTIPFPSDVDFKWTLTVPDRMMADDWGRIEAELDKNEINPTSIAGDLIPESNGCDHDIDKTNVFPVKELKSRIHKLNIKENATWYDVFPDFKPVTIKDPTKDAKIIHVKHEPVYKRIFNWSILMRILIVLAALIVPVWISYCMYKQIDVELSFHIVSSSPFWLTLGAVAWRETLDLGSWTKQVLVGQVRHETIQNS